MRGARRGARHTFIWEGIDGSRIFTHFPPADTYNGTFSPEDIDRSVHNFKDGHSSGRSLYLFGWGDGGGGPQPEMIESAHRLGVEIGRAGDFFEAASAEANGLTTSAGELYFELHRGTYTSQSRTKRLNRLAQQALREAEMWSVAAGGDYPSSELEGLWKTLTQSPIGRPRPSRATAIAWRSSTRRRTRAVERRHARGRWSTSHWKSPVGRWKTNFFGSSGMTAAR